MEIHTQPLTVEQFAEAKGVPVQVILKALSCKRIIPIEVDVDDWSKATIHPAYLDTFLSELISVDDYSKRKNISRISVYNKIDSGKIEYFLDPLTNTMKIDWVQFHDVKFRAVNYKHIGNNHTVNKS